MKNQNNHPLQSLLLATIATVFLLAAAGSALAQPGSGAKYGSRDLTTCADTKAPTKGAITADLAAKYSRCTYEKADGNSIGLLEDLKIQVGGAVPFSRKTYPYASDVDPQLPVYPLRGSYRNYMCNAVSEASGNRGANCTVFVNTKAEGVCWKTTFGDWWCAITNGGGANDENLTEYKMPPPGSSKAPAKDRPAVVATVKVNNKTTVADPPASKNKDESDYPKPDFTEMEKFYEIKNVVYNPAEGKLFFVAKMTKENNAVEWTMSFYDADDIKLGESKYTQVVSGEYYKVGDLAKFYFYLPTESIMRRVTRVVVTRNIY